MLKLLFKLSALILCCCNVTLGTTEDLQQLQLSSLTDRMNRMISSLYNPSSKSQSPALPILDTPSTPTNDSPTYSYPTNSPQLFYVAPPVFPPPPPYYFDPGVQPGDYGCPGIPNPFPRSGFPAPYSYDLGYRSVYPPYPYPPPYPAPPIPKPSNFFHYPEYPQPQHRPVSPPLTPPHQHAPYPLYPPPYHALPPSYPTNFTPYPPNPYAKPHDLNPSSYP